MASESGISPPPLHPLVQPLAFLLGTWRGEGEGGFPTIQAFNYGEQIQLSHWGKKTWKASSGEPMHAESGYWRPKPDGSIEVIIAQSTCLAEVQKGTFDEQSKTVSLKSAMIGNATKVNEIWRNFEVSNDELMYTVSMATSSHALQPHLRATLKKL
ncbi:hypothetical protein O6H91_21G057400 [Diphasiastrum complanatum]|uniref:Uncharacterized protein n=1 Tax=Diphasiastrum complanatum TaxID=34168 RepID=A0ACC2AKZ7_DIPCM|nr:hypothetical protein O6H91_21G057400 [Diphasiastrum complanatum]